MTTERSTYTVEVGIANVPANSPEEAAEILVAWIRHPDTVVVGVNVHNERTGEDGAVFVQQPNTPPTSPKEMN